MDYGVDFFILAGDKMFINLEMVTTIQTVAISLCAIVSSIFIALLVIEKTRQWAREKGKIFRGIDAVLILISLFCQLAINASVWASVFPT